MNTNTTLKALIAGTILSAGVSTFAYAQDAQVDAQTDLDVKVETETETALDETQDNLTLEPMETEEVRGAIVYGDDEDVKVETEIESYETSSDEDMTDEDWNEIYVPEGEFDAETEIETETEIDVDDPE